MDDKTQLSEVNSGADFMGRINLLLGLACNSRMSYENIEWMNQLRSIFMEIKPTMSEEEVKMSDELSNEIFNKVRQINKGSMKYEGYNSHELHDCCWNYECYIRKILHKNGLLINAQGVIKR